jgi:hypothetical protein
MDLSIRVIAIILFATCVAYASRHPHLSVVQIVKDHHHRAKTFASSAAERQDYEELLSPRQAFSQNFLPRLTPPQPPKTPGTAGEVRILPIK